MSRTASQKTWNQLRGEIDETFRKWKNVKPIIECVLPPRSTVKANQSIDERMVKVSFYFDKRMVNCAFITQPRAIDNLETFAKAIELIRLSMVRDVFPQVVAMHRQMRPDRDLFILRAQVKELQDQLQDSKRAHGQKGIYPPEVLEAFETLCVAPGAPIEVVKMARKAFLISMRIHPDLGGDTEKTKVYNKAFDTIDKFYDDLKEKGA